MADIPTPLPTPRLLGVRALLITVALLELADGLPNWIGMFTDMSAIPGPDLARAIIQAHIAAHPVLALAALLFAAIGRVRYAIIALGAVVIMTWLNYMPSVLLWGLDFAGVGAFQTPAQVFAFPLLAASAILLAARNRRLKLAAVLVSIPTLFNLFGLIAFAIGIAIHGF
jgi:hypothetical protein